MSEDVDFCYSREFCYWKVLLDTATKTELDDAKTVSKK